MKFVQDIMRENKYYANYGVRGGLINYEKGFSNCSDNVYYFAELCDYICR